MDLYHQDSMQSKSRCQIVTQNPPVVLFQWVFLTESVLPTVSSGPVRSNTPSVAHMNNDEIPDTAIDRVVQILRAHAHRTQDARYEHPDAMSGTAPQRNVSPA